MTYSETNEAVQALLAEVREQGRQEERRRLAALSPISERDLRRLLTLHSDPVPELAERLGAVAAEYGAALEQMLGLVERTLPLRDIETHAAVLKARALMAKTLIAAKGLRPRLTLSVVPLASGSSS